MDDVITILKKLLLSLTFALFATQAPAMFIQPDWFEVTEPGVGTNRYAYSGNDPINKLDPGGNLTDEEGVAFTGASYTDKPADLDGWEHLERNEDESIGFLADVYRNTETGEIAISIRGTDGLVDVRNGWGIVGSPQHKAARDLFGKIAAAHQDAKLSGTGHSMGGGLAVAGGAFVSDVNGGDYIVFDSMGKLGAKPENTINYVAAERVMIKAGSVVGYPESDTTVLMPVDPLNKTPFGMRRELVLVDVTDEKNPGTMSDFLWNHSFARLRSAFGL